MQITLKAVVTHVHSAQVSGARTVTINFPDAQLLNRDLVIDSETLQLDDQLEVTIRLAPRDLPKRVITTAGTISESELEKLMRDDCFQRDLHDLISFARFEKE